MGEITNCAECGMRVEAPGSYHPYAACLMFRACTSSATVEANLQAVVEHGRKLAALQKLKPMAVVVNAKFPDDHRPGELGD